MNDSAPREITTALLNSILTGPLLIGDLPEAKSFCRSKLQYPDVIPDLNLQQKLGHLFEDALASVIVDSDAIELLEQNLQLRDERLKTVGEMDFLLRDHSTTTLIHLELATKFYLAVETPNGLTLPGPDARDNFFRKLARLRDHQLQLPTKFRSCLPPEYSDTPVETEQLIFGCLFDHFAASEKAMPEFALTDCRRGIWLHQEDCESYFDPGSRYEIIPKALWPVPFELFENISLAPWTLGEPIDRCLMVRVNKTPIAYFIAPSGYPNQNPATT